MDVRCTGTMLVVQGPVLSPAWARAAGVVDTVRRQQLAEAARFEWVVV